MTFKNDETATVPLELPCNGCIGCRIARSKEWAVRCMHEASLHEDNCFITLTYDDEHIPLDNGLDKTHFQKFMKRLRKKFGYKRIRYYMCGEYGSAEDGGLGRPHFHALLFGIDFKDKYLWNDQRKIYRSETLERLWKYGYSSVGHVNFKTAAYVARYIMKKITGDMALEHYRKVDPATGEVYQIQPEYNQMSLKPGIAYDWYQKFSDDVFPDDFVVHEGHRVKTPKYYLKQLEAQNPAMFDLVKQSRKEYSQANPVSERVLENKHINAKINNNRARRPLE